MTASVQGAHHGNAGVFVGFERGEWIEDKREFHVRHGGWRSAIVPHFRATRPRAPKRRVRGRRTIEPAARRRYSGCPRRCRAEPDLAAPRPEGARRRAATAFAPSARW